MSLPTGQFPERLLFLLRRRVARLSRLHILGLLALTGVIAVGCARGSYPLDYFYEMHYQQSYHSHEPPRLSPPAGAVPVTGRDVPLESLTRQEIDQLSNPLLRDGGVRLKIDEGKELFEANCAMCHGPLGKGDGEVLKIMKAEPYNYSIKLAPDLTGLGGLNEGTLFAIMSDRNLVFPGIEGWVMPQFQGLLSAEERWMLVNYVRHLQGK